MTQRYQKSENEHKLEVEAREAIVALLKTRVQNRHEQGFDDPDDEIDGLTIPDQLEKSMCLGFSFSVQFMMPDGDIEESLVFHESVGVTPITALGFAVDAQNEFS